MKSNQELREISRWITPVGGWEYCRMEDLKKDDIFLVMEPDGKFVGIFKATGDGKPASEVLPAGVMAEETKNSEIYNGTY